jgi:hypothetical protein
VSECFVEVKTTNMNRTLLLTALNLWKVYVEIKLIPTNGANSDNDE